MVTKALQAKAHDGWDSIGTGGRFARDRRSGAAVAVSPSVTKPLRGDRIHKPRQPVRQALARHPDHPDRRGLCPRPEQSVFLFGPRGGRGPCPGGGQQRS